MTAQLVDWSPASAPRGHVTVVLTMPIGDIEVVSFDLAVLAMDEHAYAESARQMFAHCTRHSFHDKGDLDTRIVAFYEQLRVGFPDHPPYGDRSPWMVVPLAVGVDHVIMHLSWSSRSNSAVDKIIELAKRHRLVLLDPQPDDTYLPGQPAQTGPSPSVTPGRSS